MTIGLDIGGSKINSVLLDQSQQVIDQKKIEISSANSKEKVLAQIFDCIKALLSKQNLVTGIGLGVPGPIDLKKQQVLNPPNLTALKNSYLSREIENEFKIKTVLDNDTSCFSLAESVLGAGKGKKVVIGITLGTGVGGGIVINDKIFQGSNDSAGEIGHMIIEKGGRQCSCGNKGCLETYVSASGIVKTGNQLGIKNKTCKQIWGLAKKGDKQAIEVYKISGEYLGIALANLVNVINPDIIIIGGGISNTGEFLFEPAKKTMQENILSPLAKNTEVVKAELGKDAGAIGAALLTR